jgi:cytochrome P450
MPAWNPILGHLTILPSLLSQLPKGAQQSYSFGILGHDFKESGLFYIDLWPFSFPLMVVNTPELAEQICHEFDLDKPDTLLQFFWPITGGLSLFVMNGDQHKSSRALFTPGFSSNMIMKHTAHVVDEAEIYANILRDHARRNDIFSLDDVTCRYLMDVIGTVTL